MLRSKSLFGGGVRGVLSIKSMATKIRHRRRFAKGQFSFGVGHTHRERKKKIYMFGEGYWIGRPGSAQKVPLFPAFGGTKLSTAIGIDDAQSTALMVNTSSLGEH
jgi:hypothetical protein